jgi:hypothetical protein
MLATRAKQQVRAGLSVSTQGAYLSGRRHWLTFRRDIVPGADLLAPGDPATEVLMSFICYLSGWLKHSTIKGYLSAVRHLHVVQGRADPVQGRERLRLQLRGVRRSQGDLRLVMKPITQEMLRWARRVYFTNLAGSQYQRTLWAALLAAFYGLLRCSEYAPKGVAAFDPSRQLTQADNLSVDRPGTAPFEVLFIGRSKADPFGRGQAVVVGSTGDDICPVGAIRAMRRGQPRWLPGDAPLFWTASGPLRREAVVRAVKAMAIGTGRVAADYSSHSLRRGGASALWAQGYSREQIMVLGRWRSDAYRLYVSEPLHRWAAAAGRMARAEVDGELPEHRLDWGSSEVTVLRPPTSWLGE